VNKDLNLTRRSSLVSMALHDYVCVEVIKGTIALSTVIPGAMIETFDLIVASTGTLPYCISRKRHE